MFMTFLFPLISLVSCAFAVPIPTTRDVVAPPITSPTAGTVWHVGEIQTVTWSSANLPVNITNPNGKLILGYLFNDSENLMLSSPLATDINYADGKAQITVPNVPTRDDYIVVLFGDSGNASPQFTIINDSSSSGTQTTSVPPPDQTSTSLTSPPNSTPSGSPSNSGSSQGSPSGPSTSGATTPTIQPTSGGSSTTTSSATHTTTSTPSTQTNAAGLKYSPSSHGLLLGLVFASLVFIL